MFFKRLSAKNFGPFDEVDLLLHPVGLNVIQGPNESGKTQIVGAIAAALMGRAAVSIHPGGRGPSTLSLEIGEDGYTETVKVEIRAESGGPPSLRRTVEIQPPGTSHRALNLRLSSGLSDPRGPGLFLGPSAGRVELARADLQEYEGVVPEELRNTSFWTQFRDSGILGKRVCSEGTQHIARIIQELVARRRTSSALPLVVDDYLGDLDVRWRGYAIRVLEAIGTSAQVVLLTFDPQLASGIRVKSLGPRTSRGHSLASYNQLLERERPDLSPTSATYVRGQRYPVQENRSCELKEVKGPNPLGSIKDVVDEYAVAFLNAGEPQEGRIVWGVRNEDLAVVGVRLTPPECDKLRRLVTEKLLQITPALAPTAYRVELHPISEGRTVVPDLYLVEIRIPASRSTLLFSTGSQDVYVKTDAGRKKLTVWEIQQELMHRLGHDPEY